MSLPLVTVLIVTYNHANTFKQAIESVLAQRTDFDYKIWVLDDCSTDGTSDLVREYAKNYPDRIVPFIREHNLGGIQNVFSVLGQIDTKYYATLESDDYWCDENKLQTQVDILENNPDCSICTHNTYKRYPNDENNPNQNSLYIKSKVKSGKYQFPKKICSKQFIEPHYSSRMYRTDCMHLEKLKNPVIICYDFAVLFWFLSFGKMYYCDKVMSVYNFSYSGVYSGASSDYRNYMSANIISQINEEFDYKYNSMLIDFFKKKIPVSPVKTIYIKYFAKKENLKTIYAEIAEKYIKRNNLKINSKTLFELRFPLGKRKKICFEIRREKEM